MDANQSYQLLRSLTSPVVAITATRAGKRNGLISDAALRASIVPDLPRLVVVVHKINYTHDMIFDTGRFAVHVLHRGQFDLIERLGFASGRDRDKLAGVPHRVGTLGCPILQDCYAWFECRVVNVMDTGASTVFLGEAGDVGRGPGPDVMTAEFMRANLPEHLRRLYLENLTAAQDWARERSKDIRAIVWKGLRGP